MKKITLKKIPYNRENDEALNYCNVGGDENYEIIADGLMTIGHIYISKNEYTADNKLCPVYLNWIEFMTIFKHHRLLRPTLDAIYSMFGKFFFESSATTANKYRHIGCASCGFDEITGLELFSYETKKKNEYMSNDQFLV